MPPSLDTVFPQSRCSSPAKGVGFQSSNQAPPGAGEKHGTQEELRGNGRGGFQPNFCHAPSMLTAPHLMCSHGHIQGWESFLVVASSNHSKKHS